MGKKRWKTAGKYAGGKSRRDRHVGALLTSIGWGFIAKPQTTIIKINFEKFSGVFDLLAARVTHKRVVTVKEGGKDQWLGYRSV